MNSQQFSSWLLKNADQLKLNVQETVWTSLWIPEYSSLHATINIDGTSITGHGISTSKDLALVKACAEAIERAHCLENNIHSNGVAAFTKVEEANHRAANELKERDAFLCHYVTKTPFVRELVVNGYNKAFANLKENDIKITTLQMKTPASEYGVVCLATPLGQQHSFSSIIGLGYKHNLQEAIEQAFLECLESVVIYLYNEPQNGLNTSELSSPSDHKNLFMTPKYQKSIADLVGQAQETQSSANQLHIDFEELHSDNPIFKDLPLKIARATSPDSQHLFYGETRDEHLNFKRLENFYGSAINKGSLNYAPHCIG